MSSVILIFSFCSFLYKHWCFFLSLFLGSYPQGCSSFHFISPNIVVEEADIKDDSGMQDVQYTEVSIGTGDL